MSIRLALEWSSPRISAAVEVEGTVYSRTSDLTWFRMPDALTLVEDVFREGGVEAGDLTEILIGRGPGNYTGVRQALALAMGMAAPGRLPVRCTSSGRVLASSVNDPDGFWILGDARRGLWWGAKFPAESPDWQLHCPEHWKKVLGSVPVYSGEPKRLEGIQAVEQYPDAASLFDLPPGTLTDPLEPLYLHPAV